MCRQSTEFLSFGFRRPSINPVIRYGKSEIPLTKFGNGSVCIKYQQIPRTYPRFTPYSWVAQLLDLKQKNGDLPQYPVEFRVATSICIPYARVRIYHVFVVYSYTRIIFIYTLTYHCTGYFRVYG